jgi:hypothetical protein
MEFYGWVNAPREVDTVCNSLPFPVMSDCYAGIKDTGAGKTVLLYKFVEKSIGRYNVRTQAIGDCVSFGAACAVDICKAVQGGEWGAETSTEDIYGGSRVQVGGGRLSGDGSIGAWAAKYVSEYGTLIRKAYGAGELDMTKYSGTKARKWGSRGNGTPSILLPVAKQHLVKTVTKITSVEQCRDAVANGYPVTIASNQGFSKSRDQYGFASPSGSWAHQMCITAVDDDASTANGRKGFLIQNSWGANWISGPKRLGQPDGSFWATYEIVSHIIRSGDCWAFADVLGFKPRELNLIWG